MRVEISKRSRAARRATSPSIDTDKSIKDIAPPRQHTTYEKNSVLSVHNNAGVSKKVSKRKTQMSAKARKRQQRGMEMAENVLERTSKKVQASRGKAKTVQQRAKTWDDINRVLGDDDDKEQDQGEGEGQNEGKEWETDEDMDAGRAEPTETTGGTETVQSAAPLDDDLDEIL